MAGRVTSRLLAMAAAGMGLAWEARRRAYATGWAAPRRVAARVVSIGNMSVGGTGKTTLTLWVARAARDAGIDVAVVCRRYRPGPAGRGDEELMFARALGEEHVFAGATKWREAQRAAAAGHPLILVDDGFSHWALARDLDIVLLDAADPWGRGMMPAGRLREPRRALQRADVIVASRAHDAGHGAAALQELSAWAPAAQRAAGRHRLTGVQDLGGREITPVGPAHIVTATGNPAAVERSAAAAGYSPVGLSSYRDHHWFTDSEARHEMAHAEQQGATLLLTAKDAVRWPARQASVAVLGVEWEWLIGGERVLDEVLGQGGQT